MQQIPLWRGNKVVRGGQDRTSWFSCSIPAPQTRRRSLAIRGMNPGRGTLYIGGLFLVYIAEGTVLQSYCGLCGHQTTPLADLIHQECPVGQSLLQPASTKDFSILSPLSSVPLICLDVRAWKA